MKKLSFLYSLTLLMSLSSSAFAAAEEGGCHHSQRSPSPLQVEKSADPHNAGDSTRQKRKFTHIETTEVEPSDPPQKKLKISDDTDIEKNEGTPPQITPSEFSMRSLSLYKAIRAFKNNLTKIAQRLLTIEQKRAAISDTFNEAIEKDTGLYTDEAFLQKVYGSWDCLDTTQQEVEALQQELENGLHLLERAHRKLFEETNAQQNVRGL